MKGTPLVEQVAATIALKLLPDDTVVPAGNVSVTGNEVDENPLGELNVKFTRLAAVAPSGNPPTEKDTYVAVVLHIAALAANGLNPLLLAVTLALGLKIPIEYRITATMTMISIAHKESIAFDFINS